MRMLALAGSFLLLAAADPALAQPLPPPNGLLLIAKPGLLDPNFRRTVVLVTQTEDASTVGVILNRPLREPLARFLPEEPAAANYKDRVFEGGPVMRRVVVAVLHADAPPSAPAFHVLRGVWLTMHPQNIRELLSDPSRRFRLYAGFSGWAPRQLESEFARDGWFVLPADAETVFRRNTEGMWEELVRKASAPRPSTQRQPPRHARPGEAMPAPVAVVSRSWKAPHSAGLGGPEPPGGAARAALAFSRRDAACEGRRGRRRDGRSARASPYPDRSPGIPRVRPSGSEPITPRKALQ